MRIRVIYVSYTFVSESMDINYKNLTLQDETCLEFH